MKRNYTPLGGLLRLARLPVSRWLLAVEAGVELLAMKLMVLCFAPARYASLLGDAEHWQKERLSKARIKDLIWAIESVGKYAPDAINCLPRALALQRMLRRRGASGTVRIGVKRTVDGIAAHAWLVLEGKVLIGWLPELETYTAFPGWPSSLFRRRRSHFPGGR